MERFIYKIRVFAPLMYHGVSAVTANSPGKMSFRFAGGLFVSMVILYSAVLTGTTGLTTSFRGRRNVEVVTRGAPGGWRGKILDYRFWRRNY